MADSILSSLLSRASLTISKSADPDRTNVVDGIKVVKVQISYRARAMRHMREDGVSIVDVRIIDPTTINMDVICPTLDNLNTVNNLLRDRENTYVVTSKSLVVNDMSVDDMVVKQTADMISASPVKLNFKQFLRQGGTTIQTHQVVEQPADSSVFARGIQQVRQVTASVQATFSGFVNQLAING